ncbi:MAG: hypothetical protein KF884_00615 [Fimbriimonadaceae bacterium]|nr:hypothetical protein [Fimbriimonadaceae bacterium]QYK58597.1 MAG: hypothetical protein KF884_00615 [Fimbriimonadaceae bacterium]
MTFAEFREVQVRFEATVTDAFRYGPSWGLQEEYRRYRSELQSHYPQFRSTFQEHFDAPGPAGFHRPWDPVEWLLSHPTLDRLLLRETAEVAQRLEQLNRAIVICGSTAGVA